jgi:colanic acid/amylovoran biosynthesis glycosyltransferase
VRIGYFTNLYPRATDTFIQREIAGLRQRGIEICTFSVRRPGSEHDVAAEVVAEKQNTHYLLPVGVFRLILSNIVVFVRRPGRFLAMWALALRTRRPGMRGLALQIAYLQEAILLSIAVTRQRITHLHNHLGDNSGTVTLLASKLSGTGYSITIHGPHIFFDPTHWALREKLRYSRFIVCISHYCRSQMMLFTDPPDWERLRIVRCGVDTERFRYREVRQQVRKLLYAGRLAVEKGLSVLFESLHDLLARGYEFELTLLGDGSDREQLEELARRLGIHDRLVFAGYASQEQLRESLERSDLFILPSFAEGVPVSLMEAMACGVPVLSTYVGGIAELVEPEQTGLLVPPADCAALSKAIARYCDDLELRQRVSRCARESVVARFNLDSEVDKLAQLFLTSAGV